MSQLSLFVTSGLTPVPAVVLFPSGCLIQVMLGGCFPQFTQSLCPCPPPLRAVQSGGPAYAVPETMYDGRVEL